MKMNRRILSGSLIALAVLFIGAALVQGADESGIAITTVNFAAPSPEKDNLGEEWVEITNQGSSEVSLTDWTLEDAQNHSYTFQDFSLAAGAAVKVRTGEGTDSATDLFWNRSSSVWNNDGDVATLMDASGNIVASYPKES